MRTAFFSRRGAVIGVSILAAEAICVLLLPLILGLDAAAVHTSAGFWAAPSSAHWLGTDDAGRDILARLLFGGRMSLAIGFGAGGLSFLLGIPLGLTAGWLRGWTERVILGLADVVQAFPGLLLTLAVCSLFGGSAWNIVGTLGLLGCPSVARLIYANTLSVREREFIVAARALGVSDGRIAARHLLPSVAAPVWAALPLRVGRAILAESGLSFLGAGLRPPQASWGGLIGYASSLAVLVGRPWIWVPPGLLLMLTILACQLIGDALREALEGG